MVIETLGVDADDTLWHSESYFRDVEHRFQELLATWVSAAEAASGLIAVERRNVAVTGFGVNAFTLSMIEAAIELSRGELAPAQLAEIAAWGRDLLTHPVELLPGVSETLDRLAGQHRLVLVTKGDPHHQEQKIEASGIADRFHAVEIVRAKDAATYRRILRTHDIDERRFAMIGNSVPSDIAPVLELGGFGVHVPYHLTWALEVADVDDHPRLARAERIADVPDALRRLSA